MQELVQHIDVCVGNEEDAQIMLGVSAGETDVETGRLDRAGFEAMLREMKERFGFRLVASTLRESHSASDNGWSAVAFDGDSVCHGPHYDLHLVDRGGGGAAFSAGLIFGLVEGMTLEDTVSFAAAASALKQTVIGDFNLNSLAEVKALAEGSKSGRVER
jgi:2-dehydro-3-deoxygluconokinase